VAPLLGQVRKREQPGPTLLLQDPDRPWAVYTCSEIKVRRDQWVQIEAFCAWTGMAA